MLYSKNFNRELFENPTSEYRGAPFWAWNCKLEKAELLWQIEQFKKMGMGGFHIHSRSGLNIPYLKNEFMDLVKSCNQKAKDEDMLCWLYDEDRWPSGSAGGYVTADHRYRARHLLFTTISKEEFIDTNDKTGFRNKKYRSKDGVLLARYAITLENGYLKKSRRLTKDEKKQENEKNWYAYLEIEPDQPWFNNQAYLNTLDKSAVQRFIEKTHEVYFEHLGHDFGNSIPAIFTDEPQFTHKERLKYANDKNDLFFPFTDDFEKTFQETYSCSFLDKLPEIVWDLPNNAVSQIRYYYHDHIAHRFASAFADTVGAWCKNHNIMLTGHMMAEQTLDSQTMCLGDCMRSYRAFQLPGIDLLCDRREYTTAKQAQSAVHQYDRAGVLSELYGVTNWDFDFRKHKLQGDWQAALGVTVRVHHLSLVSMEGEAKRDYPASINYQSPWYKEYPLIENHFARINTILSRGRASVKLGVIHPVESFWLHFGPDEQSGIIRDELEEAFSSCTDWLLHEHIDFNFISESLLPEQVQYTADNLPKIGTMEYETVLVPYCKTLRTSTFEFLKKFKEAGGGVLFSGIFPTMLNAKYSEDLETFTTGCKLIPHTKSTIASACKNIKEVWIQDGSGREANNLIYQMRNIDKEKWLFIAQSRVMENEDIAIPKKVRISITGNWAIELWDTLTGDVFSIDYQWENNRTIFQQMINAHDSLMIRYKQQEETQPVVLLAELEDFNTGPIQYNYKQKGTLLPDMPKEVRYSLSEPNVMLLDTAEYSLDNGEWQDDEEILRIDTKVREKLNYPIRTMRMAQPWVMPEYKGKTHSIKLRFTIKSEIDVKNIQLALETPELVTINFNGNIINTYSNSWFTDKAIKILTLGLLPKGNSILTVEYSFNPKTNIEWMYLLGDFGVNISGQIKTITNLQKTLTWGDWTKQGLPFYAGNVIYHIPFSAKAGKYTINVPQFRSPVLSVNVNQKSYGQIAFAPYNKDFLVDEDGQQNISITVYGSRINSFGQVHLSDDKYFWFGPLSWRTEGPSWTYTYRLKPSGILIEPRYKRYLSTQIFLWKSQKETWRESCFTRFLCSIFQWTKMLQAIDPKLKFYFPHDSD